MGTDQGGNRRAGLFHRLSKLLNRAAAFTGLCLCSRFDLGGSTGHPGCTDSDSRSFERVSERRDCSRLARAHALEQQFRLAIEQLKDFPFEAAIAERHSREMIAVEQPHLQRFALRALAYMDRGWRHPGPPSRFYWRRVWPDRDQIPVNARRRKKKVVKSP